MLDPLCYFRTFFTRSKQRQRVYKLAKVDQRLVERGERLHTWCSKRFQQSGTLHTGDKILPSSSEQTL